MPAEKPDKARTIFRFKLRELVDESMIFPSIATSIKDKKMRTPKEKAIANTICPATQERQDAASVLAKEVGIMIVIGGKKSSNTRKLYSICEEINSDTYLIQTEKDLDAKWFTGKDSVGITAGASTPDFIIESVKSELERY